MRCRSSTKLHALLLVHRTLSGKVGAARQALEVLNKEVGLLAVDLNDRWDTDCEMGYRCGVGYRL
jgi:hypothetical protein